MKKPLYWIGIRESEISDTQGLFAGSITIFGTGRNGNLAFEREQQIRFDYNQDCDGWTQFVMTRANHLIRQHPDCCFLLYLPDEAELYGTEVAERTLCRNPKVLLELLNNKFLTRQWLSQYVPILPYQMQYRTSLNYSKMLDAFPNITRFVVQTSYSCGGSGTWFVTKENHEETLTNLDPEGLYAVSPYQTNSISPNIHLLIYPDVVILLPPSIQLIQPEQHGFSYKGADYRAYKELPARLDDKLKSYALKIGNVLRKAMYRGVCGIDFLISSDTIYLMEINARFQSSTFLINRAMREAGCKFSVQSLQMDAFQGGAIPQLPPDFDVPYSFFHYSYNVAYREQLIYTWQMFRDTEDIDCVDDNLDWSMRLEPHTYLYKAVFHGSISAQSPDFHCRLHGNVGLPTTIPSVQELCEDLERLKWMLLAHGTRLSQIALARLNATGGFNHEEFDALDLVLKNHIYICVPYESNRSQISPFCVELQSVDNYFLSYYGKRVIDVRVRLADAIGEMRTDRGILYHDITYLGNDRLRVYHRSGCYFKDCNIACKFCDIPKDADRFTLNDIFQAIDAYRDDPRVRHYLIGGGSMAPDDQFETVVAIAEHIRETTKKPIYLMSLPPQNDEILMKLKQSGITEVAFNLEVFDRKLAQEYMPGKGTIPLSAYETAFETATRLWGKTGNVRTIFIVGLEPTASLLEGIRHVARIGVAPILVLLRPVTGTALENKLPPPDEEIWEICRAIKSICHKYRIELGPACPYCEDNTLKITL